MYPATTDQRFFLYFLGLDLSRQPRRTPYPVKTRRQTAWLALTYFQAEIEFFTRALRSRVSLYKMVRRL